MTHIAVTVFTPLAVVDLKQMWFNGKVGKLTWMTLESQPLSPYHPVESPLFTTGHICFRVIAVWRACIVILIWVTWHNLQRRVNYFIPTTASLSWNLLKPDSFAAATASSLHRSCAASCMLCSQAWRALPNLGMCHLWGALLYRCMTCVLLPSIRSLNWFADFCWNLHSIHTDLSTHYYVVAPLLDSLANLSFSAGVFPMCYKVSHIVQLFMKAGLSKEYPANYQQITNLCTFLEVLEREWQLIIFSHIWCYLEASSSCSQPMEHSTRQRPPCWGLSVT